MKVDVEQAKKVRLASSQDTYEIFKKIFFERHEAVDIEKEHFWIIALNRGFKILAIELVSMGSNGRTIAEPPEIFRIPLYKSASDLILVHNHPSGNLKPSEADLDVTNRLIQVGLIMNINVRDHVIVTERSYYSFQDNGLIEKLSYDNKYALTFVREKQIAKKMKSLEIKGQKDKKAAKKVGLLEGNVAGFEKGRKMGVLENKKGIAIKLLQRGMSEEIVKKVTGLSSQMLSKLKLKGDEALKAEIIKVEIELEKQKSEIKK